MYIYMYVYTLYSQRDSDKHLNSSEKIPARVKFEGNLKSKELQDCPQNTKIIVLLEFSYHTKRKRF